MVLILGGGISGLSAAHYLIKIKHFPANSISIIEAAPQVGGWMKSTCRPNNVIYEHGPRTIRPRGEQGSNTLSLVDELGLQDKVKPIRAGHPATINRLVYVNKLLHKLPSSIPSMFLKKQPFDSPLIYSALKYLASPTKSCTDEPIYDFVARRFGNDIADYAVSPLVCGICAGDAKEISVKFLMRSLFEAEQKHGSAIKGLLSNMLLKKKNDNKNKCKLVSLAENEKWNVWSLEGGIQVLPQTLEESLRKKGVSFHLNSPCKSLTFGSNGVKVVTENNEYKSKQVISALPAFQLSQLVKLQHPKLCSELGNIPFVTVGVVNLTFPKAVLKEPAFGFLVPPSQKLPILGVVYDSCCFPPKDDCTVLTVMMGGRFMEKYFGKTLHPDVAKETAVKYTKEILGIKDDPCDSHVSVLQNCIPQYVVGHDETLKKIHNYLNEHQLPLSLVGSSYEGVGVNDAIMSSKRTVERMKMF